MPVLRAFIEASALVLACFVATTLVVFLSGASVSVPGMLEAVAGQGDAMSTSVTFQLPLIAVLLAAFTYGFYVQHLRARQRRVASSD